MVKDYILLFVVLMTFKTGFATSFTGDNDSLSIKQKIKDRARACKQLCKKRIIYRLNADTLLLLGRNKDETIVGYVGVEDYKNDESKIYIYDSIGLFHVTVRKNVKRLKGKEQQIGFCYFESGSVIKQGGEISLIDSTRLLREAAFLRDYVAPLRTNFR